MKKTVRLIVVICTVSGLTACDSPDTKALVDAQVTEEVMTAPASPVDIEFVPPLSMDSINTRPTKNASLAGYHKNLASPGMVSA